MTTVANNTKKYRRASRAARRSRTRLSLRGKTYLNGRRTGQKKKIKAMTGIPMMRPSELKTSPNTVWPVFLMFSILVAKNTPDQTTSRSKIHGGIRGHPGGHTRCAAHDKGSRIIS